MKCLKTILLWVFFSYAKQSFGDISNFLFQSIQCTLHTYVCDFLQNILFVEYINSHNFNVCRLGSFCFKPCVFYLYQRTTFSLNDLGYQGILYTRSCIHVFIECEVMGWDGLLFNRIMFWNMVFDNHKLFIEESGWSSN